MKHKKWICLALASVFSLSMIGLAACGDNDNKTDNGGSNSGQVTPGGSGTETPGGGGGSETPGGGSETPGGSQTGSLVPTDPYSFPVMGDRTTNVSVHDPSVFYDENSKTYYAFGTHYAVASSKDLIHWTQEAKDDDWKKLYGTESATVNGVEWPKAIRDTVNLIKPTSSGDGAIKTTWAPDVNYYNGKYYMYYSLTAAFGSSKSAIARVESDNVMGPYSNNTILFSSDGSGKSNAIDPELFYDKEGGLWMVYGSTFGGIFIVELENSGANWGLPKETPEAGKAFGKNIWAQGNNVEGPFVFYNELTDYYYIMTSYGALMYNYNMRIARSKNPDGPYEDVTGQKMTEVAGNGSGGNKVAGSYKFAEQATGTNGYAAMGHNSVVKDTRGRYFVIYHARSQGKYTSDTQDGAGVSAGHTLYVSQLFFNEDGWPVMSPVAYAGEKAGLISQAVAAGEYDIVIHSTGTTAKPVNSEKYTLGADGTVKKGSEDAGTWTVKQDYYVEITIGGVTYKGVIVPGWDMYSPERDQYPVFAITAVAPLESAKQGGSLWGISPREE